MRRYVIQKSVATLEYFEVTAEHEDQARKIVEYGGGIKFKTEQEKPRYINLLPDFESEI